MTAPSAQPWPSRPAPAVHYVDPETLQERRSGTLRLRRQCKFYRDDPRAPLEPWPDAPALKPEPVAAD